MSYPMVPLDKVLLPVERPERPGAGTTYRQIGVRLWGEGAYQREAIDGSQTKYATLSRVEADDIIVNKIWARNGSVAVVPPGLAGSFVSGEFPTFTSNRQRLEPRWLHWLTKTRTFWEACDVKSRGTSGKNRIRPERFLEIVIPLPSIQEQRRVVARVDALAAKLEEAQRLRREAMEDVSSAVIAIHVARAGERVLRLGQLLALHECQEPVLPGGLYPQVGVLGFGGGLFAKEAIEGSRTTYRIFNRLYSDALVLSQVKGWEGAIAVCPEGLQGRYVSPEYRTFRCLPGQALPAYLSALVTKPWFWGRLHEATRGMGGRRERTRPEQFLRLELPMPSFEDQRAALPLLERLDAIRRVEEETAAELEAMLPAVLERAFRGEPGSRKHS